MQSKWTQLGYWRDKQAAMAVVVSLATYLYNSALSSQNYFAITQAPGPIVRVSTGALRGVYEKSREGVTFASFYGIPYGKFPVNELRFKPPLPVESWDGIRDTTKHAPECMQIEAMVTGRIFGDEDCLTLNVFSNAIDYSAKLLPVLVFFHGGLFISGGAKMYGPKYFMDHEVVLVVIQYRLGALGFLSTGDSTVPGNMGLWDQNLALKWIQENIQAFNGDPNQVTLFGNSAGGSSVHFHMLSPYSTGLFHKALSQSGTALKIWTLSKNPKKQLDKFSAKFNCSRPNSVDTVNCLRKVDARDLVKVHLDTMSPIRDNTDLFVPTVDGDFIPDDPLKMLKNGTFQKLPWLLGVNGGEGLLNTGRILADDYIFKNFNRMWDKWMPLMLDYDPGRKDVSDKIKQYYFGKFKGTYFPEDVNNITSIYSDRVYFHATEKAAKYHAKHAPVFMYYYSYASEFTFFKLFKAVMPKPGDIIAPELKIALDVAKDITKMILRMSSAGVNVPCHADELLLLFSTNKLVDIVRSSKDYQMSKQLVKTWTDFAKLNVTTFKYQNIPWMPVQFPSRVDYMDINLQGKVRHDPFLNVIRFWDSLNIA